MILVDSSVWIDYFNGRDTDETIFLDGALSTDAICIGDIILAEVLQGFRSDKDYRLAQEILLELPLYQIMTPELALMGADNYRPLRKGIYSQEICGQLDCHVSHKYLNE